MIHSCHDIILYIAFSCLKVGYAVAQLGMQLYAWICCCTESITWIHGCTVVSVSQFSTVCIG